MATRVIMPKSGMAMEEGTIVRWFKKEGDAVVKGEPLLEIITHKVNIEIESEVSGVLLKILCFEDEVVPVTQTIGFIGEPGESTPDVSMPRVSSPGVVNLEATGRRYSGRGRAGSVRRSSRHAATPLARRIAAQRHIDLTQLSGSGCRGRIRKEDVLASLEKNFGGRVERKPLRGIRKIIAERMRKSHREVPSVTLDIKVDVTGLDAFRARVRKSTGTKITYNDIVLKATAIALEYCPYMNASLDGDDILLKEEINLGMAVSREEGLIVPVIKRANTLALEKIAKVSRDLAQKARDGGLLPDDCTGGTFTLSNLGMYEIVSFTPIINPPECGILGICAIEDELRMMDESIENRSVMRLSLTFDHRVVDGAQGATFLSRLKALLENPEQLVSR